VNPGIVHYLFSPIISNDFVVENLLNLSISRSTLSKPVSRLILSSWDMPDGDHGEFIDQTLTFRIVTSQDIIFTLIQADQLINHQLRISKDFNCIGLHFLKKLKPLKDSLIFSLIIGGHWLDSICELET
jgi:hypothetical protein